MGKKAREDMTVNIAHNPIYTLHTVTHILYCSEVILDGIPGPQFRVSFPTCTKAVPHGFVALVIDLDSSLHSLDNDTRAVSHQVCGDQYMLAIAFFLK